MPVVILSKVESGGDCHSRLAILCVTDTVMYSVFEQEMYLSEGRMQLMCENASLIFFCIFQHMQL